MRQINAHGAGKNEKRGAGAGSRITGKGRGSPGPHRVGYRRWGRLLVGGAVVVVVAGLVITVTAMFYHGGSVGVTLAEDTKVPGLIPVLIPEGEPPPPDPRPNGSACIPPAH